VNYLRSKQFMDKAMEKLWKSLWLFHNIHHILTHKLSLNSHTHKLQISSFFYF